MHTKLRESWLHGENTYGGARLSLLPLIFVLLGLLGAYSSILWYGFSKTVRQLTGTRWAWGLLSASPIFTLLVLYIGLWGLLTGAEWGMIDFLLLYVCLYFLCLVPTLVWAKSADKIPEWSDLRYTLRSTDAVIFSFLNWGRTRGGLLFLIFLPLLPSLAALFARLKAGISPPRAPYEEREKPSKGMYSARRKEEEKEQKT